MFHACMVPKLNLFWLNNIFSEKIITFKHGLDVEQSSVEKLVSQGQAAYFE